MTKKILCLPGDGIGPEIMAQARKVLQALTQIFGEDYECEEGLIGGHAIDLKGSPLPEETIELAKASDGLLLAAVGGPKWDELAMAQRPEKGLLGIRKAFDLFANLRPAILYPQLVSASSLKPEIVSGLNIMIVRELTGGIYFGEPRGIKEEGGQRSGFNTMVYSDEEIKRITEVAVRIAKTRQGKLCSVDKANVLEVSKLWRDVVTQTLSDHPDVNLSHMYVDNAAMQLVKDPKQFDVIVTGNMFGDILSDCAAQLTGSIGMLPSASLNTKQFGLYEPVHGSAPDIAGEDKANPLALFLSLSMMLRYSFSQMDQADALEEAIHRVLEQGLRTPDIQQKGMSVIGCSAMGDAVVSQLLARQS